MNLKFEAKTFKNYFSLTAKVLPLMAILTFTGCFNKDSAPETSTYDIGNFQNGCKIDADRLKKLLETDVIADINCVENNLKQFSDFVNRSRPDVIKKEDLEKFIKKFFPDQSEQMVKSLSFLFELNTLFLRDKQYEMSVPNLKNIFDLVRMANRYGAPLNHVFKKIVENKKDYWKYRPQITFLLNNLSKDFTEILGRVKGPTSQLAVMSFLSELKKSMDLKDDQLDLELIESMLFVKKLFIGGEKETISTDEISNIIPKLEKAVLLAFDFVYMNELDMPEKKDSDLFFLQRIKQIGNLFHSWHEDEVILTHDELMVVAEKFLDGPDLKVRNLEETIVNIKAKIIGGETTRYSFGQINTVINFGLNLYEQLYFNDVTYEFYREQMESKGRILDKDLVRPELPEYKEFERPRVFELWQEFKTIITQYRIFHAPEGIQYYINDYQRYLHGVNLQALIRFGLRKALNSYGHPVLDPATGKMRFMAATKDELRVLLLDVKTAMVEFKLWPHFFERFLGEAMNSSDLFQFQSDGDGFINLEEASEYVANIISSSKLAKDMYEALKAHCDVVDEVEQSFEVECYREHFFKTLFVDMNYTKYYQKLYDYTNSAPKAEVSKFLINVESFAKEIRDPKVPMAIVDIGRLFVSLSNIESTFMRYDGNRNNIMDRDELEQGFLVFKLTILGFAKLKPTQESLGKSIYLYILKNMKVPKTLEALMFHVFGNKDKVTARRIAIGTILAIVAEATINE